MKLKINNDAEFDVCAIGSALLDFTVEAEDSLLEKLGLKKGEMHLIDEKTSGEILRLLGALPMTVTPGGSSANTAAGIMNFSGSGVFNGKVGGDENGNLYIEETEKTGVVSDIKRDSAMTGHAITFITPDMERTFATHLGAAVNFTEDDVSTENITRSRILHLEGYLFEPPGLFEACGKAMRCARDHGVLVSIDLSDPALIGRIHERFVDALNEYADIVFVNEDEAEAYTGKQGVEALEKLSESCPFAVVKLGEKGSIIKSGEGVAEIPVFPASLVNTNGAGDMYAAGTLYGICRGFPAEKCGRLGSYGASLVVSQQGARYREKIRTDEV